MLRVSALSKRYDNAGREVIALDGVNLEVGRGEMVTLFGPNGSGKSTLFSIIAGLEPQTAGTVSFDGHGEGSKPRLGVVFQDYDESMFPWFSVLDNVLFPLDMRKVDRKISLPKAEHILKKVRLWEHRDKYLYQLSGGMKQLAAISRAFITEPEVLLMDEPCSALDYSTTKRVEEEILSLWEENSITALVVSHDVDEAIFLADKVVVLSPNPGRVKAVIAVDLPRPRNLSVLATPEFFAIRAKVLKAFMYE